MTYHSGNELIDPELLFQKAQLRPGMRIADFGCGRTGHIVFPAGRIVGEKGIVYAVDIIPDILETITKRAKIDGCLNVHTIWSDIETVGAAAIPENSIDVIFIINVLAGSKRHDTILMETRRLLKDKARLIIVDWARNGLSFSPGKNALIDFGHLIAAAKKVGFVLQEEFAAGKYHHGVVLYKHV